MSGSRLRSLNARFERWLDYVFFALLEVSVLPLPVLILLTGVPNQDAVSLSALAALGASTVAVGSFRGGYVDVGQWPIPSDFVTVPFRSAYYGFTIGGGTWFGVAARSVSSRWWMGVAVTLVFVVVLLAGFPRAVRRLQSASSWEL